MSSVSELIELPAAIQPFSIDKPAIGIDLGMEYTWAGQYIRQNGKSYVKLLKIGGNEKFSMWSGIAFDGRTIHVGEAAKLCLAVRRSQKVPVNGAYRIKEFMGAAYDKVDPKSIPFPVHKDPFGRVGIVVKEGPTPDHVTPEEISTIYIRAILQDMENLYGISHSHIAITQADRMSGIDAVLLYGVLKMRNINVDKIINDSQAAVLAYGVEIENHSYIVFNFGETECFCTLISDGRPVSSSRNNVCGALLDVVKRQRKDAVLKNIKEVLTNMFNNVNSNKVKIDGIILGGDSQGDVVVKEIVRKAAGHVPVLNSIDPKLVYVVGATVFAAKRLQAEMEVTRPLNGVLQEMAELRLAMGLHGDQLGSLPAPPAYDNIVNNTASGSDAPPPWSPPGTAHNEAPKSPSTSTFERL